MMNRSEQRERVLKLCLGGILVTVLLFFIIGEWFGPSDVPSQEGKRKELPVNWERVYPDGTREQVTLPGDWKAERGETVRAEALLPDTVEDPWAYIRASQQDVRVYVDGVLREEYSTKDTRPFGKTSASAYVFFRLYETDAGKVLAVETISDSVYSGRMNQIYTGEKQDIVNRFMEESGMLLLVSFTTVILSLLTVVVSLILCVIYKKEVDILYLGLGTLLTSLILIVESVIRQFFLTNITVATLLGFFLTMLAPYPFVIYANLIQKKRYRKIYTPVLICILANFLISTVLHIAGIVDLMDSMFTDYAVIVLALVAGACTMIADMKRKMVREYWEVAVGLGGIILASLWEIYQVYLPGEIGGGFVFCGALCFLLLMASLKTGRDMQAIEKEKQRAIVAGEAKAQFLAQMSHEIRTPINTIIGMNEMVLRENKDETIREYAENIRSSSKLLMGLISDVLDFSKIEAGKLEITENRYALGKMLDELVQELRFKAETKGLRVESKIAPDLPETLIGDELRVRQIVLNLISNAVKYTHQGSVTLSVHGETTEEGFVLCASVRDTGIGIKAKDADSLFGSFQRLEERKNRHIEGTGLGLAITKQLLDLMDGDITVESEYGKGSCFTVRIPQQPVKESVGNVPVCRKETNREEASEEKRLQAPEALVLAVDDNAMNLAVVRALLKRTEMQVETATGGTECLELCRQKKYDLILMDHMMPEPDGIETLHLLRKEETLNRETPVLVLTANAVAGMEEQYLKEGFAGYLSKPLVAAELENVLAGHLPEDKVRWIKAE